jgi:hypothetical protein
MQKKLTLLERFKSDTPGFFKRAQLFGLGLAGVGTSLAGLAGIPAQLCTVLISAGSAIAIIAQFAVKQYEPINTSPHEQDK